MMESCIVILVQVRDEAPVVEVRLPVRVTVAIAVGRLVTVVVVVVVPVALGKISPHAAVDDFRTLAQGQCTAWLVGLFANLSEGSFCQTVVA